MQPTSEVVRTKETFDISLAEILEHNKLVEVLKKLKAKYTTIDFFHWSENKLTVKTFKKTTEVKK